jgi:hypothetical protein
MLRLPVRLIVNSSCIIVCIAVVGRAADSIAKTIIGDFAESGRSVVDVAVRLSRPGIPVGIEAVNGPERAVDLDLKGATVADVLNAATIADPRYQWREVDGVINLFPKQGTDPIFDVTINHFEAENEPAIQMINQLLNTPEVKRYLGHVNMQASTLIAGSFLGPPPRGDLSISSENLRRALNDVLVKTRSAYWSASHDQQNGKKYLWFQAW